MITKLEFGQYEIEYDRENDVLSLGFSFGITGDEIEKLRRMLNGLKREKKVKDS